MSFSVDVLGSQFLVERFSCSGTVLDISRKGLLAEVDRLVAVGTDCVLSLVDAESLVWPVQARGRVRRSCIEGAGWQIGVEFDELVDVLPQVAHADSVSEVRTA